MNNIYDISDAVLVLNDLKCIYDEEVDDEEALQNLRHFFEENYEIDLSKMDTEINDANSIKIELMFIVNEIIGDYQKGLLYKELDCEPQYNEELNDSDHFDISKAKRIILKLRDQFGDLVNFFKSSKIHSAKTTAIYEQLNYIIEVIIHDYEMGLFDDRL